MKNSWPLAIERSLKQLIIIYKKKPKYIIVFVWTWTTDRRSQDQHISTTESFTFYMIEDMPE